MKNLFLAAAAMSLIAAPAMAGQKGKSADAGPACVSAGATAKNSGQWLKLLRDNPLLLGLSPREIAELENTSPGWAGFGNTPNVGALTAFFCDKGNDDG